MPVYTRTWDESEPLGSTDPRLIDNFTRELKVDFRERINTIIGVAEATALADPVVGATLTLTALRAVLTASKIDSAVSGQITIPWSAGQRANEAGTITLARQRYLVTGVSATGRLFIPVESLRVGNIITKVSILVLVNSSNHVVTTNFFQMSAAGADTTTTPITQPANSASPQWADSGTIAITVAANDRFGFQIDLDNQNMDISTDLAIYGVRVFYTSGDAVQR